MTYPDDKLSSDAVRHLDGVLVPVSNVVMRVIISVMVMCDTGVIVGYDRRIPGLSNAPLDRSPQYGNHGIEA